MLFIMLNSPSKRLPAQYEDTHGISKTVFTHVSRFHGLLDDWIRLRDKGTKICKTIISLKLHECTDDYFPPQLQSLTEGLLEIIESFKDIVEGIAHLNKQLQALEKLQQTPQPVILTWTAKDISDSVNEVYSSLRDEYTLKTVITESSTSKESNAGVAKKNSVPTCYRCGVATHITRCPANGGKPDDAKLEHRVNICTVKPATDTLVNSENMAHCRDEKQLEVYATAWEIESYLNLGSTAYLFAEVGLNPL